jgi:anti-sigma factor RsiW
MSSRLEDEKLAAYIAGELSDEEREEIEQFLENDEPSRQALDELLAKREMANMGDQDAKETVDSATLEADSDEAFSVFSCGDCQAKYTIAFEKVRGKVFRVNCKKCGEAIIIRGDTETPSDASLVRYSSIPERPSLIGTPLASFEPGGLDQNEGHEAGMPSAQVALSDGSLFNSDADSEGGDETGNAQGESADRSFPGNMQREVGPRVPAAPMALETGHASSVLFSRSGLENLAASSTKADAKPRSSPSYLDEPSGLIDIRALSRPLKVQIESEGEDEDDIMSLGAAPTSFNPPVLKPQFVERMNMWMKITIIGCVVAVLIVGGIFWKTTLSSERPQATSQQIVALREKLEALQELQKKNAALQAAMRGEEEGSGHGKETGGQAVDPRAPKKNKKRPAPSKKIDEGTRGANGSNLQPPINWAKRQGISPPETESSTASVNGKAPPAAVVPVPPSEESSSAIPDSPYASASAEPASLKEVASERKGTKEVDALLGQQGAAESPPAASQESTAGGVSSPTSSSGVKSGAKQKLDRGDVQKGMHVVAGSVKACGKGQLGKVTVKVVIGQTGRVASAVTVGSFAGTAVGSCAAKEVRKAKFPISQNTLTVKYPFDLQ